MAAQVELTQDERNAQKNYWLEHSSQPTVEAMMLDSKAAEIDQLERPEVLATLGDVSGKRVLELGAGIGRFTGELAKQAKHVVACDFMEVSIAENRRQHEALGNVSFMVADVTELEQEAGSYDVVFSNWLLMYLSDAEVKALAAKVLRWLAPGGVLFFRESCFRPSGDRPRKGNPTHYRNPRDYFAMFDGAELVTGGGASSSHLELFCCKCVDTYVTVKRNQNQICWKFHKVETPRPRQPLHRTFLDTHQYSDASIALYEAVYGRGFVSPGGQQLSARLLDGLQLQPASRLLDVGCGIGGNAFLAADTYGCHVHGIDLSVNMILVAIERAAAAIASSRSSSSGGAAAAANGAANGTAANGSCAEANGSSSSSSAGVLSPRQQQQMPHDVTFEVADVLTRDFDQGSFDVCVSRDALLHVQEKQALFSRLFRWLKPGGKLLITDYCQPSAPGFSPSPGFASYIAKHRYSLLSLECYSRQLAAAGFAEVQAEDCTAELISSLEAELAGLQANKEKFTAKFSAAEYESVTSRWQEKLARAQAGEQRWGKLTAVKPQQ
ncbi:S-adenosyl-L-methionine-dependent methyltransferase [Scenedesmus sp. NREL 46B-D3]|nr:S-adenosyl-L-methionine-dependent methyltransferase [Scenedesmus sp. NREL 46B-D3]